MKTILIIAFLFFSAYPFAKGQSFMAKSNVKADKSGNPMLLGICDTSDLSEDPFSAWYLTGYKYYQIDSCYSDSIRAFAKQYSFCLFFGSWCGDSRREVPRMLKVFHQSGFSDKDIRLVAVSNSDSLYKQSPEHEERGQNIIRVPTLIVLKNGKETGRIIESPIETIEKDLLHILQGRPYRPNYSNQ